jgi:FkbM family methyltransferase
MTWRKLEHSETLDSQADLTSGFGTYKPNFTQRLLISICRHSFLKRGSARRLMTNLILSLGQSKLDIYFRGAAYRIFGESNLIEYGLLLKPDYNAAEIDFLLEGATVHSNFIDVGCNIGLYTLPLCVSSPAGKTLAIDANPKMVGRIRWNAEASKLNNLVVVHTAVGDVNGQCDLAIAKDDVAIVAVEERADGEMPMRLLFDVVSAEHIQSIHGLKIDIEGYEDKALVPFLNSAPEALLPKKIVIEHPDMNNDYPGCAEAFGRLGYQLRGRTRNNSLYELIR